MIKPIAYYLPQFHPIPENDLWWGKGFTEWTNVAKAKPLFKGHWQPRLPADLGFYDLRVQETRIAQAEMAKSYGIYGFAYWHYWFGDSKQLLNRPIQEVVVSGQPDFPFCLAWANQTWSGTWHGLSNNKILIEQKYLGDKDIYDHFYSVLPMLKDPRYIRINGMCVFQIYQPNELPDPTNFISIWQKLAKENGLEGIYFIALNTPNKEFLNLGFDKISFDLNYHELKNEVNFLDKVLYKINPRLYQCREKLQNKGLSMQIPYDNYLRYLNDKEYDEHEIPVLFHDWDNTPRSKHNGWKFDGASPSKFKIALETCLNKLRNKDGIVFLKSWNEWAEGNYLEPDERYGFSYLDVIKEIVENRNKIEI